MAALALAGFGLIGCIEIGNVIVTAFNSRTIASAMDLDSSDRWLLVESNDNFGAWLDVYDTNGNGTVLASKYADDNVVGIAPVHGSSNTWRSLHQDSDAPGGQSPYGVTRVYWASVWNSLSYSDTKPLSEWFPSGNSLFKIQTICSMTGDTQGRLFLSVLARENDYYLNPPEYFIGEISTGGGTFWGITASRRVRQSWVGVTWEAEACPSIDVDQTNNLLYTAWTTREPYQGTLSRRSFIQHITSSSIGGAMTLDQNLDGYWSESVVARQGIYGTTSSFSGQTARFFYGANQVETAFGFNDVVDMVADRESSSQGLLWVLAEDHSLKAYRVTED